MRNDANNRRLPIGAEPLAGNGTHFRVWAPDRSRVSVVFEDDTPAETNLAPEGNGYFAGHIPDARAGMRYRYRLDGGDAFPDPASRYQPEGPHGPSQIIDPTIFAWSDADWPGVGRQGQALYEMHVGTFTHEGTWEAAARQLPALAELGVTVVEVMPVADFTGKFGWGYDGVDFFAPTRLYGTPDDLRRFVDRAHALGLGIILDVVYNHFGPDGNYLPRFARDYGSAKHGSEWGDTFNFDGPNSAPVREFVLANVAYWIGEFHVDGLRLDATQQIFDDSPEHILAAITRTARQAAGSRSVFIVGENEPQHARLVRAIEQGGFGLDALWNDDFHRSAVVALTGRNEAYYSEYLGTPQELISALKFGFLYQGQRFARQHKGRGTSALDLPPAALVTFLQNHDQVANSARGLRVHDLTSPGRLRAMTALLLLGPGTPLLFQGQEFAASSPFLYFADHPPELATLVREGRGKFLAQFPSIATPEAQRSLADPASPDTFTRCKLDHGERTRHAEVLALHRDLLRLRRDDPLLSGRRRQGLDGAVLGAEALVMRYFGADGDDRLLLLNLGRDLRLVPAPEPLLAPPSERRWALRWSSEDRRYGGGGTALIEPAEGWFLPGHAALVFVAEPS